MMKQFDHMIERKLNLELSNVFPRLKFLTGCGQFSDFSNIILFFAFRGGHWGVKNV